MKTATISSTIDLTEGGCNACGITKCEVYTLTMDGRELQFDELSVESLMMTLALKYGWRQETKYELFDEFTVFKKGSQEVALHEDYDERTYTAEGQSVTTKNTFSDTKQLFDTVNEILTGVFSEEAIDFQV